MKKLLNLSVLLVCLFIDASLKPVCAAPSESLDRLLNHLDSAPVSWDDWERNARRGDKVATSASQVASVTKPLMPCLESASKNSTLSSMARIPLVGGTAKSVQNPLILLTNINRGFSAIVEADARHIAPLRAATRASARLRRTRSCSDVPAVSRTFDKASKILNNDYTRITTMCQKISTLNNALQILLPIAEKHSPSNSRRMLALNEAKSRLASASLALDHRSTQLRNTAQWLDDGATKARAAQ